MNANTAIAYCTYGTTSTFEATDNNQWRVPLGVQIIPAGILAALILLFPESPRWLEDHGFSDKTIQTLAKLHANGDTDNSWVVAEYEQIKLSIADERENGSSSLKELFTDRASFRRLLLVTSLQASVQMTGVSAVQYFAPTIYKQVGVGTSQSLLYQGIGYIFGIAGQLSTILFIDRIGRRWPLIIGNLVCSVCFIVTATVIAKFYDVGPSTQNSLLWLFLVFGWIFQYAFSFTAGSLSWVIPSEVFDTKTRAHGVAIGCLVSFAFNTLIGQITGPGSFRPRSEKKQCTDRITAIESTGWRYFLLFVICNITNALFFWAFMPETKGRPLEEMNKLFSSTNWFVPTTKRSATVSDLVVLERAVDEKRTASVHHVEER